MNRQEIPAQLKEALDYLHPDNLWTYDIDRMSLYLVGLKVVLHRELPHGSFNEERPIPTAWANILISTCISIRYRLEELNIGNSHRIFEALKNIVEHVYWLFSSSYHLSQHIIDQERFNDKVYRLLEELNLRGHQPIRNGSWDPRSSDEIALAEFKYRQELLDFVKEKPAEVIATVYQWANHGVGHNAKIRNEREELFKLFQILESEKSGSTNELLN